MNLETIQDLSIDQLLAEYQVIKAELRHLKMVDGLLRQEIARRTETSHKTRYLIGTGHRARIEMPADHWDQATLKQLWHAYPDYQGFLRVEKMGVNLRELHILERATVHPDMVRFRTELLQARREPTAPPTVTIEEI